MIFNGEGKVEAAGSSRFKSTKVGTTTLVVCLERKDPELFYPFLPLSIFMVSRYNSLLFIKLLSKFSIAY